MLRLLPLALLALALTACGGGDEVEARISLVVPDNNIRVEGIECAGARPFRHVRRGAPWRVEDEAGEVLADGTLPAGVARNADPDVDWGVERIPTVCVMELEVGLPERERYAFRIGERRPIEFDRELLDRDERLILTVS